MVPCILAQVGKDFNFLASNAVSYTHLDVYKRQVLEAAREPGVRLVGLSALMTTTVAAMAETIALLRERVPGVKIMVGGAVLTEDYAREMGADFYRCV